MANKNSLSIYLIKDGKTEQEIFKDSESTRYEISANKILRYKQSPENKAKWVKGFFSTINQDVLCGLYNTNTRASLLVKLTIRNKLRQFVITFGYGHNMLNTDAIEEHFGLRVVANILNEDEIKKAKFRNVESNNRLSNVQLTAASSIDSFGFNKNGDIVSSISGKPKDDSLFKSTITGSDKLSCYEEYDLNNIDKFLKEIFICYEKNSYKDSFPWIDNIKKIKNKQEITELDNELWKIISKNADDDHIFIGFPDIEDAEYESLTYKNIQLDDISKDSFLNTKLFEKFSDISKLKSAEISAHYAQSAGIKKIKIYNCIYTTITAPSNQKICCISGGHWYEVDSDYAKKVYKEYSETESTTDIIFPAISNLEIQEEEYNKQLANANASSILMDKRLISYGGGSNRIELCDVLTQKKQFIHVKRFHGSASLSHLFNQGLVSAKATRQDDNFRQKASKEIQKGGSSITLSDKDPEEVIYAIIPKGKKSKEKGILEIPFFSKVSFIEVRKTLELSKIKVVLLSIPVETQ